MSLPDYPISRAERYLSNIAGQETSLPAFPISRIERYLDYIAKNGGGSSNVLVVNATVDFEHAESETELPLILDKTMAEMLAAENTVMSIDVGEGFYILTETYRVSADDSGIIMWTVEIDGMKFGAQAILDGGVLSAVLSLSGEGGEPDETDEFTVYDTQYSGNYGAYATHSVSNPENAKQAIFTFDFHYGAVASRLSGTAEARLVSRTTSGDSTTLVYQAIVEQGGKLWCVTVTSVDSNGSRTETATAVEHPTEVFVLHGVLSSETTGTIVETATDLLAAAEAKKRIMLRFPMDNETINLEMGFRYFYTVGYSGRVQVDGMFRYNVNSTPCLVKVLVSADEQNYPALVMSAEYFALTPLT